MNAPQDIAETVVDPKAYADGRVHDAFRWLRREAPFAKLSPAAYDPFWAVTRHADIMAVESNPELFCSSVGVPGLMPKSLIDKLGGGLGGFRTVVSMDGPEHSAYRRITQGELMPQKLRRLEERFREIARSFVDQMAASGGRCDFARDVAFLYPLRVLMELMGAPATDEDFWLGLTQTADVQKLMSEEGANDGERMAAAMQFLGRVMQYFTVATADRRANPTGDMTSVVANGQIDGKLIGDMEAMGYYVVFATAGHDTTSASTAGGMGGLAGDPEQFARLKADPGLIPALVEESIRWVTPVKHFARTATADTEFAGQKIAKGDRLALFWVSATRDEAVFSEPDRFNIERTPNKHIAFGYGPHVCLGQHLAKMEMRILWEELLPRLESLELDGPIVHPEMIGIAGPRSVPIRFRMN